MRGRRKMKIPVPPPERNRPRVNEQIRISRVRLIDENGEQAGEVSIDEARKRAQDASLDLVEVAPNAKPPVVRIMDYGKYLFELQKKERQARKKQQVNESKEIRLRPGTGVGDMKIKVKHAKEFLGEGQKVVIQLQFRGREMAHRELGIEAINKFVELLKEDEDIKFKIEQEPKAEGRRMSAVIAPGA